MKVKQRSVARAKRPLISRDDLSFLLEFPALAFAACCIAEKGWHRFCLRLEMLKSRLGAFSTARIIRGLTLIQGNAKEADAFDIASMRSEHHIQIIRDYFWRWTPEIVLLGREHVDTALGGKRGAVLWVAHFCFNALATKKAFHSAGYAVSHLSRPEHGFSKSRFGIAVLNPIRVKAELRYLRERIIIDRANLAMSLRKAQKKLARNEIVSMTAGAWEGARVATVDAGRCEIDLATGAPGLALLTGAALLPVITIRDDATGQMLVIVKPPLNTDVAARSEEAVLSLSQAFMDQVMPYVREHPMQWRDWEKIRPSSSASGQVDARWKSAPETRSES